MPGLTGLLYQKLEVPFAAGLHTKEDPRAVQPPGLTIGRDVEFDTLGGLETRYPFGYVGKNILGGGTLANVRRVFANGSELCCFTDTALYSWSERDTAWVLRGTHLAVATTEATRFATTDDQIDSDRAELNNTIVYTWTGGGNVYVAAIDKANGAVILAPTSPANLNTGSRPRLVACSTKILLFYVFGGATLKVIAIDPANVATSVAAVPTNVVASASFNLYYDVCRAIGADEAIGACRNLTTTTYTAFSVTSALVVTTSSKARTCDGPIAVSSSPTGTQMQVVRANGTAIQGDLLTISTLADVFTGQAIGTATSATVNQIAAAHRSVQDGGQYRCYAFWSSGENPANAAGFAVQSNWVDTGNTLGVAGQAVAWCGVGSRAFDYGGRVFFWAAFGQTSGLGSGAANTSSTGNFQNAYFLIRDDGFQCAKAVYARGGGLAPSTGRLPGVSLTAGATTFSWCATERRLVKVGQGTTGGAKASAPSAYAARAPRDVTFTFDSNDARRTVRLGNTLYVAGGECLQYDGAQLVEVGFHVYPWYFDAIISGPGTIANGTYGYKSTFRWDSAQGEIDRSSTATVANATMVGGPSGFSIETVPCPLTHKTANKPAVEIWRTEVNPPDQADFFLVSSLDPSAAGSNGYISSSNTNAGFNATLQDAEPDATASVNSMSPDNNGVLPSLAPPAASIIAASADRLFLAGVAGDPDAIWYSKQRNEGEIAAFFGTLRVTLPKQGGAITGLALVDGVLVAFRQRAIYALGDASGGFDNTGGGNNYGPVRQISYDVGAVNPDAIAVGPFGAIFKSDKGWYLLGNDFAPPTYIGDKVAAFDGDTVYSVHVVESKQQVRVVTNARVLVFDYFVNEWIEWTITDAVHACLWNGTYVYAAVDGPKQEQTTYVGVTYGADVELAFFKPVGLMGRMTVRRIQVLGEYRSACALQIRLARDYQQDGAGNWSYYDDEVWTVSPTTVGSALQVSIGPSQQMCEAIKVRLTAINVDGNRAHAPDGEALKLTGIAFEIGTEDGLYSQLPVAQKI